MLFDVDLKTTDINGRSIECTLVVQTSVTDKDLAEEIAVNNFTASMQAIADARGEGPSVRKFIDENMMFDVSCSVSKGL